jgi:hypothetical protein
MAEAAPPLTYSLDIDRRQSEPAMRAGRSASDFGRGNMASASRRAKHLGEGIECSLSLRRTCPNVVSQ